MEQVLDKYNLDTFIETGTFLGDTVDHFKKRCRKVISIELSKALAEKAKIRFRNDTNVEIIQGDSGRVISEILDRLDGPALFWLDGHYSGEMVIEGEKIVTALGDTSTPVLQEIDSLLPNRMRHVILIDDARLFGTDADYPFLADIKKRSYRENYRFTLRNDIVFLEPKTS